MLSLPTDRAIPQMHRDAELYLLNVGKEYDPEYVSVNGQRAFAIVRGELGERKNPIHIRPVGFAKWDLVKTHCVEGVWSVSWDWYNECFCTYGELLNWKESPQNSPGLAIKHKYVEWAPHPPLLHNLKWFAIA